jgi:hypothetical protein
MIMCPPSTFGGGLVGVLLYSDLAPEKFDDLRPLLGLLDDTCSELGRRAGHLDDAELVEPRLHLRIGKAGVDLAVEPVDDLRRRIPGRADAVERARLVARQEIAQRRNLGECRDARRGGHRQRPQLARPYVSERARRRVEHELHLSADQIGERLRDAAIRHVHHVEPGHHLEELAGDVGRGPIAAGTDIDLAGIGLGIGDEFRNGARGKRRIDFHHQGPRPKLATGAMSRMKL